jgi:hypothetical protein
MARTMPGVDTRHINRDSLFLMAELSLEGDSTCHRVKVRNLSAGGMMGEGDVTVMRGARVSVALRNLPAIEGSVAWVQENRFGVAFATPIDARAPRTPVGKGDVATPRYVRPATVLPNGMPLESGPLRKL